MRTFLSCFSLLCLVCSLYAQTPDAGFGKNGKTVSQQVFFPSVSIFGGYVQPGGRLIIGGHESDYIGYNSTTHVCGFTPGGAPDTTFGTRGVTELDMRAGGFIAKQSDNKIIVAGFDTEGDGINYIVLQRLKENGKYDPSFGKKGKTITLHYGGSFNYSFVRSLAVDAADNIYVGGTFNTTTPIFDPAHNRHLTILKYSPDGILDTSFYIEQHNPFEQDCREITVLPDGSLVASYLYHELRYNSACLIKYRPDGSVDKSFGEKGFVLFGNKGYNNDSYVKLHTKLLPDGSLLTSTSDQDTTVVMYKVLPNGRFDNSFGKNGILKTGEHNYYNDNAFDIEPCGKILLPVLPCGMKRLLPDGNVDKSFGKNGTVAVAGSNEYGVTCERAISQPNGFFALGSITDFFRNGKYGAVKFVYTLPAADEAVKQVSPVALSNAKVSMYPNPAHQFLQVYTVGQLPMQLRITDMNGKTVMIVSANSSTQSVDISRLANGTYFLQIGKENAIRFIKQ